jgi:hypothetical protein
VIELLKLTHNSLPASGTGKDNNREMVIGRSEDRDNPWCPLVLRHHRNVWDPIRVPHLGPRSVDRAPKAEHMTAFDQTIALPRPCETGAVHIWAPAFEDVIQLALYVDGCRKSEIRSVFRRNPREAHWHSLPTVGGCDP